MLSPPPAPLSPPIPHCCESSGVSIVTILPAQVDFHWLYAGQRKVMAHWILVWWALGEAFLVLMSEHEVRSAEDKECKCAPRRDLALWEVRGLPLLLPRGLR